MRAIIDIPDEDERALCRIAEQRKQSRAALEHGKGALADDELATIAFSERLSVVEMDEPLARKAVENGCQRRIKLSEATIWVTAKAQGCQVVTRNRRDFDETAPEVRIPYTR